MRRVHLVRHGEVDNPRGLTYGRLPGFGLSERGRAQAKLTGERLRSEHPGPWKIVSSPLERARETARILGEVLDASQDLDERLVEAGSWRQGLPRRFLPIAYAKQYLSREARSQSETARQVARRMRAAVLDHLLELPNDAELVVVSHQLPIWMARAGFEHGLGSGDEELRASLLPLSLVRGRCGHASVTSLAFNDFRLSGASDWQPDL